MSAPIRCPSCGAVSFAGPTGALPANCDWCGAKLSAPTDNVRSVAPRRSPPRSAAPTVAKSAPAATKALSAFKPPSARRAPSIETRPAPSVAPPRDLLTCDAVFQDQGRPVRSGPPMYFWLVLAIVVGLVGTAAVAVLLTTAFRGRAVVALAPANSSTAVPSPTLDPAATAANSPDASRKQNPAGALRSPDDVVKASPASSAPVSSPARPSGPSARAPTTGIPGLPVEPPLPAPRSPENPSIPAPQQESADLLRQPLDPPPPVDEPPAWSTCVDPAPASKPKLLPHPLELEQGPERLLFSRPDVAIAVAQCWSSPPRKDFTRPQPPEEAKRIIRWLDVYDLRKCLHKKKLPLAPDTELLAISPDGTKSVLCAETPREKIQIFDLGTGETTSEWCPYADDPSNRKVTAADIVDSEHVLTLGANRKLLIWELPEGHSVYVAATESFQLSPNRNYLSVTTPDGLQILEARTGEPCGQLLCRGKPTAVAFSAAGDRLAALSVRESGATLQCWSLHDGSVLADFPLGRTPKALSCRNIHWCGPRQLLVDHRWLVDLDRNLIVWKYDVANGMGVLSTPDDRHWYTVRPSFPFNAGFTLCAMELPDPVAAARLAEINPQPQVLLGPGSRLSLNVQVSNVPDRPNFAEDLRRNLSQRLAANKIVVAEGQAVVLEVRALQLATGETHRYGRGVRGIFGRDDANTTVVAGQKVECRAAVISHGQVFWEQTESLKMDLRIVQLEAGETIDQHLSKHMWRAVGYYFEQRLALPDRVIAGGDAEGFGQSVFVIGGTEPAMPR